MRSLLTVVVVVCAGSTTSIADGQASEPTAPPIASSALPSAGSAPSLTPSDSVGFAAHHGVTFEASLGLGFMHVADVDGPETSKLGLNALELGVGGWLSRQVALTFRLAGLEARIPDRSTSPILNGFYGASVQYWPTPSLWIGGGVGLALYGNSTTGCDTRSGECMFGGLGFDLRAGWTMMQAGRQSINLAIEITPAHYSNDGVTWNATGFGVLFGYQFL